MTLAGSNGAGPAVAGVSTYGLSGVFVHILVGSVVS